MRTKSLLLGLSLAALGLGFSACSDINFYEIDAPADLQDKIQHYQDELAEQSGGGTIVNIEAPVVGSEEPGATGWWSAFSQYFTVPANQRLHVEFSNKSIGAADGTVSNWHNYLVVLSTPYERGATGYSEYVVLRSDAYGWGNSYASGVFVNDFAETIDPTTAGGNGDGDPWAEFLAHMTEGVEVSLDVDHSSSGYALVTMACTSPDGVTFTQQWSGPVSATEDINMFLTAEQAYLEIHSATLFASEYVVNDSQPVSIAITGQPTTVDLNAEDVWGNAVATVVFDDGSATTATADDIILTVPDLSVPGVKTVVYTYALTKLGNAAATPVSGYYNVEVLNPIVDIESEANLYYFENADYVNFSTNSISVYGVFADGSRYLMSPAACTIEIAEAYQAYTLLSAVDYTYEDAFTVTYVLNEETTFTCTGDIVVAPTYLDPQTTTVGAEDNTTGFLGAFSNKWNVAPGESHSISFTVYSSGGGNWMCPLVQLTGASNNEYAVTRQDHFILSGGLDITSNVAATSDWNWDVFASRLDNSRVTITVANNGGDTAAVRYDVIDGAGELHFQYFDAIPVVTDDLYFALSVEGCHLVFD